MTHRVEKIDLPNQSAGVTRQLTVHRFGTEGARPKVYMQASLHADEFPPMLVAQKLLPALIEADAKGEITGEIILLPYANPIGLSQMIGGAVTGRYANDGSGNFNRNWPDLTKPVAEKLQGKLTGNTADDVAAVRSALREAVNDMSDRTETSALRKALLALSIDSDIVLDMHCDGEADFHLYANLRHREEVCELGADIAAPVVMLEEEAGGGAFDECNSIVWWRLAMEMDGADHLPAACFGTTMEFRGRDDVTDDFADHDARAMFRFLQRRGVITGDPGPLPPLVREASRLDAVDVIDSPAGLVVFQKELGVEVSTGEAIAVVYDLANPDPEAAKTVIKSRTNGRFFARCAHRYVHHGERIAKIAGTAPLSHRKAGALLED